MTCSDLACGDHIVPPQPGRPPVGLATVGGWSRGAAARLTPGQVEVLRLVADGLTDKAIAARLHLTESWIGHRTIEVFRRLAAHNRAHAVAIAMRAGLIS